MEKDATSEQYLESVVQDVPLHEIRKVVDSCYFDEEQKNAAILSEIDPDQKYDDLRKSYGGRYLFEVWRDGELLYQRALKQKIVRWNMSRQNDSIIYLLNPEDEELEPNGCYFIHIVCLNLSNEMEQSTQNLGELPNHNVQFFKIKDWTKLTNNPDYLNNVNFALDKNKTLYASCSFQPSI